jgi:ribose transport system substrate-binding protein
LNRYRKNKKKKFAFLAACSLMAGLLSGCSSYSSTSTVQQPYVAVICKGSQHEFWKTVEQGAMDAGEELNLKISFDAPEDESQIDVQIDMVEQAIKDNASAILLAPLDTDKLNSVIEKAAKQGIAVLTLDSDVTTNARVATIGTNNQNAGAIAARNAASLMNGKGQVAIIGHVEGAQTAVERTEGFINEIKENYSDSISIVGLDYCNGDREKAKEIALAFITRYPDLTCLYGTNEGAADGIADAVSQMHLEGRITVVGFDSSDDEIAYLEDGAIDGMIVQNPYNMGYLGIRYLYKVLNGVDIEQQIETGATFVNRENLSDEDTQWLLYPLNDE